MATDQSQLDRVFFALADKSRREVLIHLVSGPATVGDVGAPLDMAGPSVSKHIKVLEEAGLVHREVRGRQHWLSIDPTGLRSAVDHLKNYEAFWEMSLDRLKSLLETDEQ
jgi:DNA-binding transcriptional ArsR family regulator